MRIHREGTVTIVVVLIVLLLLNYLVDNRTCLTSVEVAFFIPSLAFFIFIVSFFRNPRRSKNINRDEVVSPCDGKIVAIEETEETEYFHSRRIQVSIFMSPLDVHVNYTPLSGEVTFRQYHPGTHLVAWHPKSSSENERSTIVIMGDREEILIRQIAGAVARRIVTYIDPGAIVNSGDQLGFIKFGSRVDLFFPLNTQILVKINDVVKGSETVVAKFVS